MQWHNLGSLHLYLLGSRDPPTSASQVARTTGVPPPHLVNFCIFLLRQVLYHVAQAGLALLGSRDLPTSASKVLRLQA